MSEIDTLIEKANLEDMLEFETQIFLDIVHNDGLVVAAKGLLLDQVLTNFLRVYMDPGNLVIVLNYSEADEGYFKEKLNSMDVHSITFSTSISEREDMYLSGGIHFVTTRILVVDMLKKRIPIEKITGIVVLKAHQVIESCQEAFVLRLFRQNNKTGFIKGFSNSPQSFTAGFGHVERIMRTLFVKELYLWPRFHSLVIQNLKQYSPEVVELQIPISETMNKIQTSLLDLMNLTVKELKRINKTLELQEITVENCLTKKFHKVLQSQLDCVWHQLSSKSKQLVADLKTLRHLIITMLYTDPVTFYSMLTSYRSKEYAQTSTWVLLKPAELLFTYAKQLVLNEKDELNIEFCPKWKALSELLRVEIPAENKKVSAAENTILVLCQDVKTCYQLNQYLIDGPHKYLFLTAIKRGIQFKSINENFKNCGHMTDFVPERNLSDKPNKKLKTETGKGDKTQSEQSLAAEIDEDDLENLRSSYILTMSSQQEENVAGGSDETVVFEPFSQMENMDLTQLCETTKTSSNPTVLIQSFRNIENGISLYKILLDVNPTFIVMYHSDISAVRQIELYKARRPRNQPLKVYFLIHAGTVEEQSYLTSLRREKEAFEYLIQTKSTMVVTEDQDGKSEQCTSLQRDIASPQKNTRQGGKTEEVNSKKLVIVDMREFRSELPALIHKRGIEIEPVTITIGDYILTPEICVERKSLSDLIGSLNSGRLYQQCTQMVRFYAKPMLLIEFDQYKPFSWQSNYMISEDADSFDVQQKLLLLTLHFPKLKIIWSPSPYSSAQLFEELKEGKEEPSAEYASAVGSEENIDVMETKYNTNIYDFMQKLPGITSKNIDIIMRKVKNLDEMIKLNKKQLKEILGNTVDAENFYSILHESHTPKEQADSSKQKNRPRNKFKYVKKTTY